MKLILCILISFTFICKSQIRIKFPELIFDDKAAHFYIAMTSAIIVGEVVYQTTNLDGLSPLVGFSFGVTITLGKEYFYDRYLGYGVFSKGDIIAGCMGSLTGAMIHRIIIDLRYKKEQKRLIKLQNSKRILD